MTKVKKIITVDLARRGNTRLVFTRQNDSESRRVIIRLTDGGIPYEVSKDTAVTVNYLRSDGESAAFTADILDDGTIDVLISSWALSVSGEVKCSISLYEGDSVKLTSADFILDVEAALYTGEDISEDENYSLLTSLMSDIASINGVENARVEAEALRSAAEESRVQAENERKEAELIRIQAENERIDAEAIRVQAENLRIDAEEKRQVTVDEQNARIAALYGKNGNVKLEVDQWDSELQMTLTISDVKENDLIIFYPASINDRELILNNGIFIEPNVNESVTVTAKNLPTEDINMYYFICRGAI